MTAADNFPKMALGLYRYYIDATDEELSDEGVTRDEVLHMAREFDDDATGRYEKDIALKIIRGSLRASA